MASPLLIALLVLQAFHVAFLAFHDWIPLGRLNDVRAVRAANPGASLLVTTVLSTVPYAAGLMMSLAYRHQAFPGWVTVWLWVSYGPLFGGELRAWWIPYLIRPEPERAARYQAMFGRTVAFLPPRNGISPNALHVVLHAATVSVLILLGLTALSAPA
ncbi:MAG TPA: hypothetical protein VHN39_00245 [Phenylobacterium sp.]|nr:hypothetical protein [Phenylobacterium sp.]